MSKFDDFTNTVLGAIWSAVKPTSDFYDNVEKGIADLLERAEEAHESSNDSQAIKDLLYYQTQAILLVASMLNKKNECDKVYEKLAN